MEGKRAYIENGAARKNALEFIAAVRCRLHGMNPDSPLSRPLCEVGYATFPLSRLRDHKSHKDSNYLMNLIEAVCKWRFVNKYEIKGYVLFHLFEAAQSTVGEILFSRLSQCYMTRGGGFSHYPAGRSVQHAWDLEMKGYRDRRNQVCNNPEYIKKMDRELAVMNYLKDKYDELLEKRRQVEKEEMALKQLEMECAHEKIRAEREGMARQLNIIRGFNVTKLISS